MLYWKMASTDSTLTGRFNITELPNPTTDLAFLPPNVAHEVQIGRYVMVGTLGAIIWEILSSLAWDYKLLFHHRVRYPTIAYFLSRLFSLMYILIGTLYVTMPIGHCSKWLKAISSFYGLSIGFTTLLFFLRIRALFMQEKFVVAFFLVLWMAVMGTNLSIVNAIETANIGPTQFCLNASLKQYVFVAGIISLINDTLAYLAITVRLSSLSYGESSKTRTVLFGDSLPKLSRAFFKDSQLYFLLTVTSNIVNVIMAYTTSLSGTYRTMFTAVNVMISNSMACRLFRKLRFGLESEFEISGDTTNPGRGAHSGIPLSLRRPGDNVLVNHGTGDLYNSNGLHHVILVSKTMQSDDEREGPLSVS